MWCWWCCHEFDGDALRLPYKYDPLRNKFSTMGNFCSWSCMKSFNLDKNGVNMGGIIGGNIVVMRKKLYNNVGPIKFAPNRFLLKEFGGNLTIEEFRAGITKDTGPQKEIESLEELMGPKKFIVKTEQHQIQQDTEKMFEISDAPSVNEPLRLKRTKPLKRDQNNLKKTLGIGVKKT